MPDTSYIIMIYDAYGVCAYLLVDIRVVFHYFHFSVSEVLAVSFPVAVEKWKYVILLYVISFSSSCRFNDIMYNIQNSLCACDRF